jgi:hypothetical protein
VERGFGGGPAMHRSGGGGLTACRSGGGPRLSTCSDEHRAVGGGSRTVASW